MLQEQEIKRLPVLNESGKLVDVLSRVDTLKQVVSEEAKKRAAKARTGAARTLGDIMIPEIPTIPEDVIARVLQPRYCFDMSIDLIEPRHDVTALKGGDVQSITSFFLRVGLDQVQMRLQCRFPPPP